MLARLGRKLRDEGLGATLAALWRRLREGIRSEELWCVLERPLDDSIVPCRDRSGLEIEDVEPRHLSLLSELNRRRDAVQVDARFAAYVAAGYHGYVAIRDGRAVGYYWWVDERGAEFPDLVELGLGLELGPGDVYGSDLYLLEEHRDGRTANELLWWLETDLRRRGYARLWGYVAADNRPARWTYSSRGYQPRWSLVRRRRWFRTRTELRRDAQ